MTISNESNGILHSILINVTRKRQNDKARYKQNVVANNDKIIFNILLGFQFVPSIVQIYWANFDLI